MTAYEDLIRNPEYREHLEATRELFIEKKLEEDPNNPMLQQYLTQIKEEGYLFESLTQLTDLYQVAKTFVSKQPIYFDRAGLWWIWNFKSKCWVLNDETDILNIVDKYCKVPNLNPSIRNQLLDALKRIGRMNEPLPLNKGWVQFKDCVANFECGLEEDARFEATPKYFFTNPIPWEIGNTEKTPILDRLFSEWVGEEYTRTLYQIMAYSMLPDYPIHRLFCFIGSGSNGKSSFMELLCRFIGHKNICSTELETLLNSRFEITRLHKKLICIMGETNFNEITKTSILKKLTGQDTIGFEYKNKNPFEDKNYAKIIISTNNLPATTDKTDGFYRRWLIIDFKNKFSEKLDIISIIPEQEYKNLALKCGLLLIELLNKREFEKEGSIEDRKQKYEEKSNPFDKFWKDCIVEDVNNHISKKTLREKLDIWCRENGFRQLSDKTIAQYMKEKGVEGQKITGEWYTGSGEKPRYQAWIGINWSESQ